MLTSELFTDLHTSSDMCHKKPEMKTKHFSKKSLHFFENILFLNPPPLDTIYIYVFRPLEFFLFNISLQKQNPFSLYFIYRLHIND